MTLATLKSYRPTKDHALPLLLAAIVVCDAVTSLWAPFGLIGVSLWYASALVLLVAAGREYLNLAKGALAKENLLTFVAMHVWWVVLVLVGPGWTNINYEAAQEVACGIRHLSAPTFGFFETCLWGYPTRPSLVAAIPSLIFGRSPWAMAVGGQFYFFIGLPLFASGLLRFLKSNAMRDALTVGALALLFQARIFTSTVIQGEQTHQPVSLALAAIGVALLFLERRRQQELWIFAIVLLHATSAYTPSLAVTGIGLLALGVLALTQREMKFPALLLVGLIAIDLAVSLFHREDVRVLQPLIGTYPGHRQGHLLEAKANDFKDFLFASRGPSTLTPSLQMILICVFSIGMSGFFGLTWFVIVSILFLAFTAGSLSGGVMAYPTFLATYRAMVVLPGILFAATAWVARFPFHLRRERIPLMVLAIGLTISATSSQISRTSKPQGETAVNFAEALHTAAPGVGISKPLEIVVERKFLESSGETGHSWRDYMYFYPKTTFTPLPDSCAVTFTTSGARLIAIRDTSPCFSSLAATYLKLTSFATKAGYFVILGSL